MVGQSINQSDIIQQFQNKVFRYIVDEPWYIRNADLHRGLQMEIEIGKFAKKYEESFLHHLDVEAIQLLDNSELVRRLKIKNRMSWCSDY